VHWDVEPFDWEPGTTAEDVTRRTVDATVARGEGAVVLLHTWPAPAAGGLSGALGELAQVGADFVTVDQLEVLP
jgi:peptidoglycan/xylan/chitin deacetylase (PgdA/CDA1 family)